jgi:predicted ATPase/DNA-binding SARP family transcriptional activator
VPTLIDRLWGDEPPDTAVKSIQKYVSNLRRILGQTRIVSNGGYRLVLEDDEREERRFERALAQRADTLDAAGRLAVIEDALSLWRGEPYADLPEPMFLEPVRVRLNETRMTLIEERLGLLAELGRFDQVVGETAELVETHRLRERFWQLRMSALAAVSRPAEALGEYQRLRRLLGELGLEPSPETLALEERILLQDPALAPRSANRGNLPVPNTSFISRDTELARMATMLGTTRLLTVMGAAGVGKTALAIALARRVGCRYPDGAWFVGLGPITDSERVPGRVAEILGVPEAARPSTEALVEYLAHRRALIILDNCEHVIDGAADLVNRLTTSAPGVTLVATSRQPLGLAGETVFNLDGLAFPAKGVSADRAMEYPAVQLLVTRAEEGGAPLRSLEGNGTQLAEITRCLDGIPLAIELAATRLRVLSAADLCIHLNRHISALQTERRDLPERQRTLEAAIDWSYQLLEPAQQGLLSRLTVFRGGFTLDAATQICGVEEIDTLAGLSTLIDRSLVAVLPQSGPTNRYYLLRVIRLFADSKLGGEREELARSHARYFLAHAELNGSRLAPLERLEGLSGDYENLRAALSHMLESGDNDAGLRMATALGNYWGQAGRLTEAQTWLERFLEAAADAPSDLRARAFIELSLAYQPFSSDVALRASESALEEAKKTSDERLIAEALCGLGRMHAIRVEREPAGPLIEEALAIFEGLGDLRGIAQCHEALGVALRGSPQDLDHYRIAVDRYRRIGADDDLASTLFSMAYRSLIPNGRFQEARRALVESREICLRHGFDHGALHAATGLGQLARLEGHLVEAEEILDATLHGVRDAGDRRCTVRMLTALARVSLAGGDVLRAWDHLTEALRVATELDYGLSSDTHELVDALALVAQAADDHDTAARWFGAAESLRLRQGLFRSPPDQAAFVSAVGRLEVELGPGRVRALFDEGAEMSLEVLAEALDECDFAHVDSRV